MSTELLTITSSETLSPAQKERIIQLWNDEYPDALSLADPAAFDEYLNGLSGKLHLLLADAEGGIMGWLIGFIRDNEQCFAMLLDPSLQGKGYGSKLLNAAKELHAELNGWVINSDVHLKRDGSYYRSPIGFYQKKGFTVLPEMLTTKKNIDGIRVRWKKESNE